MSTSKLDWQDKGADGWRAAIGNITLYVSPDRTKMFKPARGTTWRAGVSVWDEATHTISRYGRDVYKQQLKTAKEARLLAERVYSEATQFPA